MDAMEYSREGWNISLLALGGAQFVTKDLMTRMPEWPVDSLVSKTTQVLGEQKIWGESWLISLEKKFYLCGILM